MIAPALLLAMTPLPGVAELLDCARTEGVTLVAARRPVDGAAFLSAEITDSASFSALLAEAEAGGVLLLVRPGAADAAELAHQVAGAGMRSRVLLAAASEAEAQAIRAAAPEIGVMVTGITDRYAVLESALDPRGMAAWFDYFPDAHMEYFLAGQGIATAISDFAFSGLMSAEDFALVRQQHIEILITDQPEDAVAAFGRAGDHCPAEGE